MKTNVLGIDLIKSFEGCELAAYKDIVGVLTIGFGHTGPEVKLGMIWTKEQAEEALRKDLAKFERAVEMAVKVSINSNQFAALVTFSYNVGASAMTGSTLIKMLNSGNAAGAADQFLRWNKAGGKEVKGLTRRREAERALFLKPEVQSPSAPASLLPEGPSDADINDIFGAIEKNLKK